MLRTLKKHALPFLMNIIRENQMEMEALPYNYRPKKQASSCLKSSKRPKTRREKISICGGSHVVGIGKDDTLNTEKISICGGSHVVGIGKDDTLNTEKISMASM